MRKSKSSIYKETITKQQALDAIHKERCWLQMLDDTLYADRVMEGLHIAEEAIIKINVN